MYLQERGKSACSFHEVKLCHIYDALMKRRPSCSQEVKGEGAMRFNRRTLPTRLGDIQTPSVGDSTNSGTCWGRGERDIPLFEFVPAPRNSSTVVSSYDITRKFDCSPWSEANFRNTATWVTWEFKAAAGERQSESLYQLSHLRRK